MIKVTYYPNGYEIHGHADVGICSLVTCMSWTCACMLIRSYGTEDENTPRYFTESGYSYMVFNNSLEHLNVIFNEFKFCLREWCEKQYGNNVSFIEVDELLIK